MKHGSDKDLDKWAAEEHAKKVIQEREADIDDLIINRDKPGKVWKQREELSDAVTELHIMKKSGRKLS